MQQPQIGKLIYENSNFLCKLSKTKSIPKCRSLLRNASSDQLLSLIEIALNIVTSHFKLTTRQRNRLLPYANFVRCMSRIRSERGARHLFYQKGNGFPIGLLASLVTPVLVELARKVINTGESSTE